MEYKISMYHKSMDIKKNSKNTKNYVKHIKLAMAGSCLCKFCLALEKQEFPVLLKSLDSVRARSKQQNKRRCDEEKEPNAVRGGGAQLL